jgi:hypothetical protein
MLPLPLPSSEILTHCWTRVCYFAHQLADEISIFLNHSLSTDPSCKYIAIFIFLSSAVHWQAAQVLCLNFIWWCFRPTEKCNALLQFEVAYALFITSSCSWTYSRLHFMLVFDVVDMLITCSVTNCSTGHKLCIHIQREVNTNSAHRLLPITGIKLKHSHNIIC